MVEEPAFELRKQTLDQIITAEEAAAAGEAKAAREKKADEEAGLVTAQRWIFAVSPRASQSQQS